MRARLPDAQRVERGGDDRAEHDGDGGLHDAVDDGDDEIALRRAAVNRVPRAREREQGVERVDDQVVAREREQRRDDRDSDQREPEALDLGAARCRVAGELVVELFVTRQQAHILVVDNVRVGERSAPILILCGSSATGAELALGGAAVLVERGERAVPGWQIRQRGGSVSQRRERGGSGAREEEGRAEPPRHLWV